MPIRLLASTMLAYLLLSGCAGTSVDRPTGPVGNYRVMVTDRAASRVLSPAEQAQMHADIVACQQANGVNCLLAPDLGEARKVFERGVDDVIVVALLSMLRPGLHVGACRLSGPNGETFVNGGQFKVPSNGRETSMNVTFCNFSIEEGGVWANGTWQVDIVLDGAELDGATFTIRERHELRA